MVALAFPFSPTLTGIDLLTDLWGSVPATHAVQVAPDRIGTTPPGRRLPMGKYDRRNRPLTPDLLGEHLAGTETIAAPLIGADGLARGGCLDIDAGGLPAVTAALDAASVCGFAAFAITAPAVQPSDHDGGHLWLLLDQAADPARVRLAMQQISQLAKVNADIFPTQQDIRLPFGVHKRTGSRGTLMLQTGETFSLDDPGELAAGLAAVAALPRNPVALLPPLPQAEPAGATPGSISRNPGESPIAAYNRQATVDDVVRMLEGMPGYQTFKPYKKNGVLLRCGCGQHSREANPPCLLVHEGTNGKVRLHSFSTDCRWHTGPGKCNDAFTVFCETTGQSPKDAARWLYREVDAARKRSARRDAAAEIRRDVQERATQDAQLYPADRRVLAALLECAGGFASCRPSKARLVTMTGYSEGQVKRSLAKLERIGYFTSTGKGGSSKHTAVRTFTRGSYPDGEPGRFHADHMIHDHTCLRGGVLPATADAPPTPAAAADAAAPDADDPGPDFLSLVATYAPAEQLTGAHSADELTEVLNPWEPVTSPPGDALIVLEGGEYWRSLGCLVLEDAPAAQEQHHAAPCPPSQAQPSAHLPTPVQVNPDPAPARISVDGGATFDPADAVPQQDGAYTARRKEWLSLEAQHRKALEGVRVMTPGPAAEQAALPLGATPPTAPARMPRKRVPPRDRDTQRAYYKLLNKAKTASSPAQADLLRARAAELEEEQTPVYLARYRDRRTWAVVDQAGVNVTGWEYATREQAAQARAAYAARRHLPADADAADPVEQPTGPAAQRPIPLQGAARRNLSAAYHLQMIDAELARIAAEQTAVNQ
jgi:hypothetical protein